MDSKNRYDIKTLIPQYTPSDKIRKLSELCDVKKYKSLIKDIESSNVTDDEKEFLKLAATRHLAFSYSKIADYYASASKEMQELMEDSALVIIDFDDAIAKGYVKLNKHITDILESKVGDVDA